MFEHNPLCSCLLPGEFGVGMEIPAPVDGTWTPLARVCSQ
jgi:hypothetical protein